MQQMSAKDFKLSFEYLHLSHPEKWRFGRKR